jgi:hypothetical protein
MKPSSSKKRAARGAKQAASAALPINVNASVLEPPRYDMQTGDPARKIVLVKEGNPQGHYRGRALLTRGEEVIEEVNLIPT